MNKQMKEVLDKYSAFDTLPFESVTPEVARQQPDLRDAVFSVINDHMAKRLVTGVIEMVGDIEHRLIQGPGGQLLVRIYRPAGEGVKPAALYFHGGGMVMATLDTYDASCRALTNAADCVIISVAYRQAPEHKYPAARDDAFAAYQWVLQNAQSLDIDRNQIAVIGESAGGNLAAVVCLLAKQRGVQMPVHQVLVYPMVDASFNTPSYDENADAKPLNREMMKWFWGHYLNGEEDKKDPLACPLRAEDLTDLAPATIITAEIDPLCSEGEAYADKLRSSGVPVLQKRFDGVTHEFFGMGAVVPAAREAVRLAAEQLQTCFGMEDWEDAQKAKDISTVLSQRY